MSVRHIYTYKHEHTRDMGGVWGLEPQQRCKNKVNLNVYLNTYICICIYILAHTHMYIHTKTRKCIYECILIYRCIDICICR